MQHESWLRSATQQLKAAGINTARLDALILLEDVTGIDRARLLAEPTLELNKVQATRIKKLLNRRVQHEPLAYIRGRTEFYGREFVLTPAVLEPRPESETMIDLLKKLSDLPIKAIIADVGAGSGALGITAKLELPEIEIELIEIDADAIQVAKANVDKFTLSIPVTCSDLLANTRSIYDVLLCNLPYVPDSHTINEAALHEPKFAIFGGPDGLDIYRKLFLQVAKLTSQPLYILSESLPPQHKTMQGIAIECGYQLYQSDDFIQVFKSCKTLSPLPLV